MSKSAFGFKRPEDSPGFLLWQTTITWQRLIKTALEPFDISHAQFVILAILLWHHEHKLKVTQMVLVKGSKLDKMTVSKALQKLGRQGYITRQEDNQDTRAKMVILTPQGEVLATKLVAIVESIDQQFFSSLAQAKQQHLTKLLANLATNQ